MSLYEEFKEADHIADTYRGIVKDRLTEYINSGKSPFGDMHVSETIDPGANLANIYRIEFSVRPTAALDGEILVWALSLDRKDSQQAWFPAHVIS